MIVVIAVQVTVRDWMCFTSPFFTLTLRVRAIVPKQMESIKKKNLILMTFIKLGEIICQFVNIAKVSPKAQHPMPANEISWMRGRPKIVAHESAIKL